MRFHRLEGQHRLRRLATLLPLLWMVSTVRADEGIPALLQFAEQYHSQPLGGKVPSGDRPSRKEGGQQARPATGAVLPAKREGDSPTLRRALKQREAQLSMQQVTLREQEKRLVALKQALKEAEAKQKALQDKRVALSPVDFTPLQQLIGQLRDAASGSPDAKRRAELIKEARQQAEHDRTKLTHNQAQMQALKVQLSGLEDKLAELQAQRDKLQTEQNAQLDTIEHNAIELATLRTEKQALQTQYAAVQQQVSTADARLSKQDQEMLRLQEDVAGLRERAKWLIKPENLKKPERRQAYAAGSALGRDIIEMLQERQGWGVQADRHTVLAGVIDAFSGQYQLTTDVLSQALTESETVVNQAKEKASASQQKKGESFVASFKKKKGVKQSPSGFWYQVNYVGDTPIAEDAVVEVVVKESLTDGTVIKDMELDGNVLSQPLTAYPPLFREAMGYLRNHGTLTMVVAPEQAYGEVGYPPKVPPNATMVYELRIDGIKTPTDL